MGPGFATVTLAEPWIVPTAAFTLTLVRLCGAVNRPDWVIVPAEAFQENVG